MQKKIKIELRVQILSLRIFSQYKAILQDSTSSFFKTRVTKTTKSRAKENTNKFSKHKKIQWFPTHFNCNNA